MLTKMRHPEHGQTYAHTPQEVEDLKARGWTVAPPKPQKKETNRRKAK